MKAVIIAGGIGKRLRPLTDNMPKPMIVIGKKPILEHTIDLLKENGISDIILALCYLPHIIKDHFGNGSKFGVRISYTYEDPESPLGTAGAILPVKDLISDTFIVTYADILRDLDIKRMIGSHKRAKNLATINIYKHSGTKFKSSIKFNRKDSVLKELKEMPEKIERDGKLIWSNGSFYIFEKEIFSFIPENQASDFSKDIFPKLLEMKRKISVFPSSGHFIDIGTMENLEKARNLKLFS